ncbi:Crp/Fnr family transcriptional regulator [Tepidibacter aestuarii]|uniref:Crp/Fnr family transcriptional regulator n=1 Tax=Tepidibacter aestuarii TaxID=2925782 RepID=UPI0020C13A2A|nr:helix-turn-helix domain-containing protein [Tepidibacter aestuarii]CAH2213091.1 CRP/FNR family transcriptional regulator, putaive post-exponential-phase nitrogen-starvation regulator [Tepidibacter aestuarii]
MKKISNDTLLNKYIVKHNVKNIFDDNTLKYAQIHYYEKNEDILQADCELNYYYLFVDGKIKISYLLENGKSILLKFCTDFESLGDLELLNDIPIRCNVEAIENTYLIALPAKILRDSYCDNPKFLKHIINSLSNKLDATCNNSSYNLVYPLINRLSSYIVEHITDKGYIQLNSSFKEIAQFLGTTYRHLNRTFNTLESKGIIKCDDKTIYILQEEELKKLSKNLYI